MEMLDVGKLIINKCIDKNIYLNITKLNKLSYIVFGTYLYLYDDVLSYEYPLCFKYGALFRGIQAEYKKGRLDLNKKYQLKYEVDNNVINIIDKVLDLFGNYSAPHLGQWNCRKGGAWWKTYNDDNIKYYGSILSISDIKTEFNEIYKKQEGENKNE